MAQYLAWLCTSQLTISLVLHALSAYLCMTVHQSTFPHALPALCTCSLHGSISCMAVHQSAFPLVLHALCTCLLYELISSMAVHRRAFSFLCSVRLLTVLLCSSVKPLPCSSFAMHLILAWLNIWHGYL